MNAPLLDSVESWAIEDGEVLMLGNLNSFHILKVHGIYFTESPYNF